MPELAPGMKVRFARHPRNAYGQLAQHNRYNPAELKDAFILGERDPFIRAQDGLEWTAYMVENDNIGGFYWSWVRSDDLELVPE